METVTDPVDVILLSSSFKKTTGEVCRVEFTSATAIHDDPVPMDAEVRNTEGAMLAILPFHLTTRPPLAARTCTDRPKPPVFTDVSPQRFCCLLGHSLGMNPGLNVASSGAVEFKFACDASVAARQVSS
ncbi:hypothetical protein [Ruegeria sp. MALMAid1280]|uniref:hypothetical protein n=1 Tax=Ruegeria sp. MALMAid1280 TaxID=3411634 RepID=UPI003BA1C04F